MSRSVGDSEQIERAARLILRDKSELSEDCVRFRRERTWMQGGRQEERGVSPVAT